MPVENMQPPIEESPEMAQPGPEMTDDDIAATLGFITTLSQQTMFPNQEVDENGEPVEGEEDTAEEVAPEVEEDAGGNEEVLAEIQSLKENMGVGEEIKAEIQDIKAQLEELLKDDEPTKETKD